MNAQPTYTILGSFDIVSFLLIVICCVKT